MKLIDLQKQQPAAADFETLSLIPRCNLRESTSVFKLSIQQSNRDYDDSVIVVRMDTPIDKEADL